eukprot:5173273-Pyramimonas_sp.AAC.1
MRRLVSEPNVYASGDTMTAVARHVNRGMVIGEGKGPDDVLEALGAHFLLKTTPDMTRGTSQ